mmetsp:Transcript_11937/g.48085  ORF Transcript_11937/g.48085 Transcript_11937/m.48085 type:complete len:1025 (-) Transcript_11937:50-3124(-)
MHPNVINSPFGHSQQGALLNQSSAPAQASPAASRYGAPPAPGQAPPAAAPQSSAPPPANFAPAPAAFAPATAPSAPAGVQAVPLFGSAPAPAPAASSPAYGAPPAARAPQYGAPPPSAAASPAGGDGAGQGVQGLQPVAGAPLSAAAAIHGVKPPQLYAVPGAATANLASAPGGPSAPSVTQPSYGAPPSASEVVQQQQHQMLQQQQVQYGAPPQAGQQQQQQQQQQQAPGYGQPSAVGQHQQQQQQAPRKGKDQYPSPVDLISGTPGERAQHHTTINQLPPPASSRFVTVDGGNCGPRYMRSSMYKVPNSAKLATKSAIPFGCAIQPLAEPLAGEEAVPVVEFPLGEPLRCNRCGAYVNALDKFVDGGKKYQCCICFHVNPVPEGYFSPIQPNGFRHDISYRPELCKGSVEFVAKGKYIQKPPIPMPVVFVIDVSAQAVQPGILKVLSKSLKATLASFAETTKQPIGFVTYDDSVHYYNLNPNLQTPQMLVVPDLERTFLPLEPMGNLLVTYEESKHLIDDFLDKLETMFDGARVTKCAFSAATKAAGRLMHTTGGKVIAFQTSLPSVGPGKLETRLKVEHVGTDREREFYKPQTNYYQLMGEDFSNHGIGVDLFLFANSHLELATIGNLCSITGGQAFLYSRFNAARDQLKLHHELFRTLTRQQGYDAVMRVRSSAGLDVSDFSGSFRLANGSDMCLAVVDADKSMAVYFKHDSDIPEDSKAAVQCALLYTTADGHRRIRVHTLSLAVTAAMPNLFTSSDVETVVNLMTRRALQLCPSQAISQIRKMLVEQCIQITYVFRHLCSTKAFNPQVLILPEGLKLLPLYVISLLKNVLLKNGRIPVDLRIFNRMRVNSMSVGELATFLYPRMFALHRLPERAGTKLPDGTVSMPPWERLNNSTLDPSGCFLLDNTQRMYMWIGQQVDPLFLRQVFGIDHLRSPEAENLHMVKEDNPLVSRIKAILSTLQLDHPTFKQLVIVKQGDSRDLMFMQMMVEERVEDTMSHSDALMLIHKEVAKKLGKPTS